jgi:hypothetical protein
MTDPLRIVVLTALTVFVVSSFPTGSAAAAAHVIKCDDSKDCRVGSRCDFKKGICVGIPRSAKKKYR